MLSLSSRKYLAQIGQWIFVLHRDSLCPLRHPLSCDGFLTAKLGPVERHLSPACAYRVRPIGVFSDSTPNRIRQLELPIGLPINTKVERNAK